MKRRIVLLSLAALTGCGLSERPYEQKRDWPLEVHRPDARPSPQHGPVLLVRAVQAGPGLEARGLRSLRADGSVRVDFYETWAAAPTQGVEVSLREWLAQSGRYSAVLSPGSRMDADYALEATLTDFIADPAQHQARAALSLVVLQTRSLNTSLRGQHVLTATAPLDGTDAPAIAQSLLAALRALLAQVETALAGLS